MAFVTAAAPGYRLEFGDGLVERWSTPEDTDRIAHLVGLVFRDSVDEPLNVRMMDAVRRQMSSDFPLMGPGDYAVVEDTSREGHPLVACTYLWRQEWEYEGTAFGVGQPEFVATHSDYRGRGLIRRLFAMLHARSEAEGHLAQGITGIAHFYRQFGYEYALELEGRRVTYLSLIPTAPHAPPEPYVLRAATLEDIPRLQELHDSWRSSSMIWSVTRERSWRYWISEDPDPRVSGKNLCARLLVDGTGAVCGYVLLATKRFGTSLGVYALNLAAEVNWQAVAPPLLRALEAYGLQIPAVRPDAPPLSEISFWLGSAHPIYEVLGDGLAPFYEPPYAWYVRVPDVPAFLRHITPTLERRLARSAAAAYTGELLLDFYRGGVRLVFDRGRITEIEPWRAPAYKNPAGAGCPALVFLQVLFGYRSLAELRAAFPDMRVEHQEAEVLLSALFPKKFSWVPG